jgi:hypothetical protein
MEILKDAEIQEWLRIDSGRDVATISMLESSAIDIVEHETGLILRPFTDVLGVIVKPTVPASLKHAIALLVGANFDDRAGATGDAMTAAKRLCAPFRVWAL